MADNHVDLIAVGGAEVSNDRHEVLNVVGESSVSTLAAAFVISPAELESSKYCVRDSSRTENQTEKNRRGVSMRAASGIGNLYV